MIDYQAYLIRLWRHEEGNNIEWRIVLMDPHSKQHYTLRTMEALVAFLTEGPPGREARGSSGPE